MKLYVWCDPYAINYGTSMVFAIADSEEDARLQAEKGKKYSYAEYEDKGADMKGEALKLGKPHRVVDLPCAEWHEWSE